MSVAGFLVLLAVVIVFARLDRRLWGTAATPGVLLIIGYTGVAGVYAAAQVTYYFDEVQAKTYVAVVFLALTCMAASTLSAAALRWRPSEVLLPVTDRGYGARAAMLVLVGAYLPIALVISLKNGGLWSSEAVKPLDGGGGAHLHVALEFAVVWYAVTSRDRSKLRLPLLGLAIFSLSLSPVKGWTVIPLTAVILASVLRARRRQYGRSPILRYVLAWAAIGLAVFFGIYISRIEDAASIDMDAISEIFTHFLFYLTAGFMGLNAVMNGLELPGGFAVIFAPLANVYAALVGEDYVNPISATFVGGMGNIAKFYDEELHVLARAGIQSIAELEGKRVNFVGAATPSGPAVFKLLNIVVEPTYDDMITALKS